LALDLDPADAERLPFVPKPLTAEFDFAELKALPKAVEGGYFDGRGTNWFDNLPPNYSSSSWYDSPMDCQYDAQQADTSEDECNGWVQGSECCGLYASGVYEDCTSEASSDSLVGQAIGLFKIGAGIAINILTGSGGAGTIVSGGADVGTWTAYNGNCADAQNYARETCRSSVQSSLQTSGKWNWACYLQA
jgi:hypothetical protein